MTKNWVQVLIRLDGDNKEEMLLFEKFQRLVGTVGSARKALLILLKAFGRTKVNGSSE
ncbi:MAG TPA: hypothetical protein PKV35_00735 [bacterium]|nr:hypothetical protein [bacterium]